MPRTAGRSPRIAVVGDAMMDVSARIDSDIVYASDTPAHITQQPGGSGANTAAWLAAGGASVVYVGAVGHDAFGDVLLQDLRDLGVDCRVLVSREEATGTCIVIVDGSGERTMFPDPGANSTLSPQLVHESIDDSIAHVHLSGYTLLNPLSRAAGLAVIDAARAHGCTISLDPSSAGPLEQHPEVMADVLPLVDIVFANAAEAAVLVGTDDPHNALEVLLGICPLVVVKLGPRGAIAGTGEERIELPARPVALVDSTGAGDAFAAGFLAAWVAGRDLSDALEAAVATAEQAVTRVGAGPPPH